jgi:hypothetical protein
MGALGQDRSGVLSHQQTGWRVPNPEGRPTLNAGRAKAPPVGVDFPSQIREAVRGRRNPDRDIAAPCLVSMPSRLASGRWRLKVCGALACASTWPIWPGGSRHVQSLRA